MDHAPKVAVYVLIRLNSDWNSLQRKGKWDHVLGNFKLSMC